MSATLGEVIEVLDAAYPPHLAADWDSVGLVCGDRADPVESITVAVDATPAVVAELPPRSLLLAHHPLLLRGVDTVAADTAKGAILTRLIRAGSALFTAHTNADAADPGVSDALAEVLGLTVHGPLDPAPPPTPLDKWVCYVPDGDAEAVRAALFTAGAGRIGDYSHCSWATGGTGQFLPLTGATPAIGAVGTVERVSEQRLEVVAPPSLRGSVLAALRAAHPYEEPAFDVFAMAPLPSTAGIGRVCSLDRPEPLSAFVNRVGARLPATAWGVRAAGQPDAEVRRVAVCGGAGDSLLGAAASAGVDVYLTADLRHHPADEHLRASGVALVDVAHWASERPWCDQAAALLRARLGDDVAIGVSAQRTDPWTLRGQA